MQTQTKQEPRITQLGDRVSYENQAVPRHYGTVCRIDSDNEPNMFVIGGGGLQQITRRYTVVYDDLAIGDWIDPVDGYQHKYVDEPPKSPEECAELLRLAYEKREADRKAANESADKAKQEREAWVDSIRDKVPTWAKSVIIASRHVSDSDIMTDYWGYHTEETLILGFSKHTRDLFPELRKAAANAEETKHLSIKPEKPVDASEYWTPDDEHREKYSMGGGYYLGVWRNHDGWVVSKQRISGPDSIPMGRWCIPEKSKPSRVVSSSAPNVPAHIEEHTHTKKGFQMFIVVMDQRVERDEYLALLDRAKSMGGWYSRKWGSTPGGFAFTEQEQASAFLASLSSPDPDKPKGSKNHADKLRDMAEKLTPQIENKLGDKLTNTPKRLAQAMTIRQEGERLKRTQQAMTAIAALHDAGKVPEILTGLTTKKAIYDLLGSKKEAVPNGYHSYYVETGEPVDTSPEALALWALLAPKTEEETKAQELQHKIEGLQFSKIPGYFPTPQPVIDLMLDYADLEPEHMVLEPSAGAGAICDAIRDKVDHISAHEANFTLSEILQAKGYETIQGDFLEQGGSQYCEYDRILMNPPFENLQDVDHVRHAFQFLKSGGRLVSVVSPSPFYRKDKRCAEFREWVDSLGGEVIDLPDGSFKESGTGVASKLLVIDK